MRIGTVLGIPVFAFAWAPHDVALFISFMEDSMTGPKVTAVPLGMGGYSQGAGLQNVARTDAAPKLTDQLCQTASLNEAMAGEIRGKLVGFLERMVASYPPPMAETGGPNGASSPSFSDVIGGSLRRTNSELTYALQLLARLEEIG